MTSPDPTLARLTAEVARALAALQSYIDGQAPEDDLVSLKDAQREFSRSDDTVRRWATKEGRGVMIDGRWYIRRSLVRNHG